MTSKVFRAMFAASLMTTAPLLAKPLPELDPFGACQIAGPRKKLYGDFHA